MSSTDPIRIFCGGDRSQWLAFKVLAHSIGRHTRRPFEIRVIDNGMVMSQIDGTWFKFAIGALTIFAVVGNAWLRRRGRAMKVETDK